MIKLHHINICSDRVPALDGFYRSVLGLNDVPSLTAERITTAYGGQTEFVTDGSMQIHLSTHDYELGRRLGHSVNPVDRNGHIAFRTDDLDDIKQRLAAADIEVCDYGVWGMNGWHQIFFRDPAGNVIEIHQVLDEPK